MDRKLRRRDFLKVSAVAVFGGVVAACTPGTPTSAPAATKAPAVEPTKAPAATASKQAPMFDAMAKAGTIPALDQRLPVNPLVVADRAAIGTYGGELRITTYEPDGWTSAYDIISDRLLHYTDKDTRTIVPNFLAGWEVTPDGKTYTFKLRKGMKWHTGDPVTTEDVRYWWEDHMPYKDINSSPPGSSASAVRP